MSEFLRVAEILFNKYREPMSAKELVDAGIADQLFSDKLSGKTPHQTMKAKLSVDIRRKGDASAFVRTRPGRFFLRALMGDSSKAYEARPLNALPITENVLVFPSKWLDSCGRFQGLTRSWKLLLSKLISASVLTHIGRIDAEQNEKYKQVLTYILVTRGAHLLAFRRGTFNRVEDYLRGSSCIGFGGHVSELDRTLYNVGTDVGIMDNAKRELFEELVLPVPDRNRLAEGKGLKIIGLLNDDSSPTGRKHFAVILRYEATDDPRWNSPVRGEKSITQLRWLDHKRLGEELRGFEYWSQLCFAEYFPSSVKAQPSYRIRRRASLHPPHLLCVVGTLGSGKSVATDVLKNDFGYTEVNSGRVVAEILGIPPVPKTSRATFQKKAWDFIRQPSGPTILAQAIWKQVQAGSHGKVLIDGVRQRATLTELRKLAGKKRIALLYIHTPPNIAFKFYEGRSGKKIGIHEFLRLSESPVEAEVKGMIGVADAILYNWTGELRYKETVRRLMKDVLSKAKVGRKK
jgi:predicted NUDIX family phosphoesterase/dephospho-CoA kinase